MVTHGSKGTARGYFKGDPYNAAGESGTSEPYKNGVKTWNLSFAGYASFNNPGIAIAVIVPNAYRDGYGQPHGAANIISQPFLGYILILMENHGKLQNEFDNYLLRV
ncbi:MULTISPECIES: penicillin-binding transpeptidase domain-containing protein [unclassified Mesobacillus]|uniref:penicillin-binding transpeptidase domain-containing protein n=1 Tax=unclassified Mesobacillus TaxID=2675270 RepID=UPI00203DA7A9|nr:MULTISPECIES: penicillin-binding transpeptidase domain-containing protein [unclassified Mesobacillus]MCM3126040.1 penicillin-binding transpeptidase domain-containing protein [Mesobacillus sp. MER 33]MCM3236026.1 penicillin-binding transpeptidase domain-containing protein [Mesobacillus sp. MER 48]